MSESVKMTKETFSYWDVMPPGQEYILLWKSVGEQRDKVKAVMKELYKLWLCPYTQCETPPWNSPCGLASSMVLICSRCSMFGPLIIHVKPRQDCKYRQCFDQGFVERTKPPRVFGPNQICKSLTNKGMIIPQTLQHNH